MLAPKLDKGLAMDTNIIAIAGLVISGITLLFVIGGGFYWWGRLSNRVDTLDKRADELKAGQDELNGKIDTVRDELNGKIDGVRDELNGKIDGVRVELNGKIDAVRVELSIKMDNMRDEILREMRRSEERILTALANHSHVSPEAGQPVFWQPFGYTAPGTEETTAASREDVEAPAD